MSPLLEIVILVGVIAIAILLFQIRNRMKSANSPEPENSPKPNNPAPNARAASKAKPTFFSDTSLQLSPQGIGSPTGHAIFVFIDGNWRIQEDFSKPGFEAATPKMDGAYEGHVVRTESSLPGNKRS